MKNIIILLTVLSCSISINAQSKTLSADDLKKVAELTESAYKELYPGNDRVKMSINFGTLDVKISIYDLSNNSGYSLSKVKEVIINNPKGMGEKIASYALFQTLNKKNIGISSVRVDFVAYNESYYGGTYLLNNF